MNIKPIRSDSDLEDAFKRLEQIFQSEEGTPEFDEMEILSILIEDYERRHYPIPASSKPTDVLKFLMEEHSLTQKDLPEVGSQGVVSEILSGKRQLNLRQVKALSERFKVPMEAFV